MSRFVVRYDIINDDIYELEMEDHWAYVYQKNGHEVLDSPSGIRRVEYLENSPYLSESAGLDFGDNPVVVSL